MVGERVGSYRIVRPIGEGGMGRVYLAEHPLIGKRAAIKVLLPQYSANAEIVKRFFNEARSIALLEHPGVVEVYDFGHLPTGSAYIVMELLDGESLSARLRREGRLSPVAAVGLARQLAATLATAHATGIVHRDLKPDNIFLVAGAGDATRTKILDFGIAKLGGEPATSGKTRTGALLGTPTYMSPEQCRGAGYVDHRTDIYSLGCVMYEMLSGAPPFSGEGPGDVMAAHMFDAPKPLAAAIPAALRTVVEVAMAKLPERRFQSMAEVAAALDAAGAGGEEDASAAQARSTHPSATVFRAGPATIGTLGGAAGEVPSLAPAGPRRRRPKPLFAGAGGAAVGALLLLVFARHGGRREAAAVVSTPAVRPPPAPAAPPPVPRAIRLTIDSEPEDAQVYDAASGAGLGRTPLAIELSRGSGRARYTVRRDGFVEQHVDLATDHDQQVRLVLPRARRPATHRSHPTSHRADPRRGLIDLNAP